MFDRLRREETRSLGSATAGVVAAADPASDPHPSRNRKRLRESPGIAVRWGRREPKPANGVITDPGAAKPAIRGIPNPNPENLSIRKSKTGQRCTSQHAKGAVRCRF